MVIFFCVGGFKMGPGTPYEKERPARMSLSCAVTGPFWGVCKVSWGFSNLLLIRALLDTACVVGVRTGLDGFGGTAVGTHSKCPSSYCMNQTHSEVTSERKRQSQSL